MGAPVQGVAVIGYRTVVARQAYECLGGLAAYDHLRIVYRISPVQLRHYKLRVWVTKPGRLLRIGLRRYLHATRSFKVVTDEPQPIPDYVLRGRIIALEQVEEGRKGARWYARVALVLRLHRASDSKVIWSMRMDRKQQVKKRRPQRIVTVMTALLRAELDQRLPSMIAAIKQELAAK